MFDTQIAFLLTGGIFHEVLKFKFIPHSLVHPKISFKATRFPCTRLQHLSTHAQNT